VYPGGERVLQWEGEGSFGGALLLERANVGVGLWEGRKFVSA